MNTSAIPFFSVLVVFPLKLWLLWTNFDVFNVVAWCVGSAMWLWITWAYWKNRDMPAYAGSFRYENGKNQFARTMYAISTLVCYLIAALAAWH